MGLNAQETQARDRNFQAAVRQASITTALTVAAESSSVTNHTARSAFATRVLTAASDDLFSAIAQAVVSDGTTLPGTADNVILTRVSNLWNALAGGL